MWICKVWGESEIKEFLNQINIESFPDYIPPVLVTSHPKVYRVNDSAFDPNELNNEGIFFQFSETMDKANVEVKIEADRKRLNWEITWQDNLTRLVLTPKKGNELTYGQNVTVSLSGLRDLSGNAYKGWGNKYKDGELILRFTTVEM